MAIIPKNILNELVNSDGTRIGSNNVKLSRDNSKSASNSTMDPMYDIDGDQIRNSVVQSTRQQGYRGYLQPILHRPCYRISYAPPILVDSPVFL